MTAPLPNPYGEYCSGGCGIRATVFPTDGSLQLCEECAERKYLDPLREHRRRRGLE